jgi:hypothetical protein
VVLAAGGVDDAVAGGVEAQVQEEALRGLEIDERDVLAFRAGAGCKHRQSIDAGSFTLEAGFVERLTEAYVQAVLEDTRVLIVLVGDITGGRQDGLREELLQVGQHVFVDALIDLHILLRLRTAGAVGWDQAEDEGGEDTGKECRPRELCEEPGPEGVFHRPCREPEDADEQWKRQHEIQEVQDRCLRDGQLRELHMPEEDGNEKYDQLQGDAEEQIVLKTIMPECLFFRLHLGQVTSPMEARTCRSDRSWIPGCNLRGGDPAHG